MKIRDGFISNSSSTCFLLDMRDSDVKKAVDSLKLPKPHNLCRNTCKAVGKDATEHAKDWRRWIGESHEISGVTLDKAILDCANKIGEDNVAFIRESDEDCISKISNKKRTLFENKAMSSFEYH
jgi:hypothetical protein